MRFLQSYAGVKQRQQSIEGNFELRSMRRMTNNGQCCIRLYWRSLGVIIVSDVLNNDGVNCFAIDV